MAKFKLNLEKGLLDFIQKNPNSSSKEIYEGFGKIVAYATVKRGIQELLNKNLISTIGKGKATKYQISKYFEVISPIDIDTYFEKEIDEREIKTDFNFTLIKETLNTVSLFTDSEISHLANLQNAFTDNISKLTKSEYNKEFERLAIDLSW